MAAATLVLGIPQVVTLSGTAGLLREVIVPAGARWLILRPVTTDAELEVDTGQSDEGAEDTSAQLTLDADSTVSVRVRRSAGGMSTTRHTVSYFLSSGTNSSTVQCWAVEETG